MNETLTTLRSGSAASKKGRKRVEQILEAAMAILVDGGGEHFSMNRVAAETGISLGNLQYYFPRRKDLIQALLDRQVEQVHTEVSRLLEEEKQSGRSDAMLLRIVDFILDMNMDASNCAVVWNANAMSWYNEDVKEIVDRWFEVYQDTIESLVKQANPSLPKRRREYIAAFIVSACEGEAVVARSIYPDEDSFNRFRREFRKIVVSLVAD